METGVGYRVARQKASPGRCDSGAGRHAMTSHRLEPAFAASRLVARELEVWEEKCSCSRLIEVCPLSPSSLDHVLVAPLV